MPTNSPLTRRTGTVPASRCTSLAPSSRPFWTHAFRVIAALRLHSLNRCALEPPGYCPPCRKQMTQYLADGSAVSVSVQATLIAQPGILISCDCSHDELHTDAGVRSRQESGGLDYGNDDETNSRGQPFGEALPHYQGRGGGD